MQENGREEQQGQQEGVSQASDMNCIPLLLLLLLGFDCSTRAPEAVGGDIVACTRHLL